MWNNVPNFKIFSVYAILRVHWSSRPEVFCKKGVLAKFTGKHLCQISFLKTLLEKRLWHRCFPVNLAKFLRTLFLTEHLRWLLLKYYNCVLIKYLQLIPVLNFSHDFFSCAIAISFFTCSSTIKVIFVVSFYGYNSSTPLCEVPISYKGYSY